jgi:hypothetical protein
MTPSQQRAYATQRYHAALARSSRRDASPAPFDPYGGAPGAEGITTAEIRLTAEAWRTLDPAQKAALVKSGVRVLVEDGGMVYEIGRLVEDDTGETGAAIRTDGTSEQAAYLALMEGTRRANGRPPLTGAESVALQARQDAIADLDELQLAEFERREAPGMQAKYEALARGGR